jgi:hypothetical protein
MRAPRNIDGAEPAGAARFRAATARRRAGRIRALVSATACAFASAASAQFAPPGGFTPYSFAQPEAAAAGLAAGAASGGSPNQRCYWHAMGRSSPQQQCEVDSPAAPKK